MEGAAAAAAVFVLLDAAMAVPVRPLVAPNRAANGPAAAAEAVVEVAAAAPPLDEGTAPAPLVLDEDVAAPPPLLLVPLRSREVANKPEVGPGDSSGVSRRLGSTS